MPNSAAAKRTPFPFRARSGESIGATLSNRSSSRPGFTLVEILVATALTLLMLGVVVTLFGYVGDTVSDSRATMEMNDRLRAARDRLQRDLEGVTVTMLPPRRPELDEGYFEIVEGPAGHVFPKTGSDPRVGRVVTLLYTTDFTGDAFEEPSQDRNGNGTIDDDEYLDLNGDGQWNDASANNGVPDMTVGDNDDILMFTTRTRGEPFVGHHDGATIRSNVGEVAWFLRGTTLYRRVLLVKADATQVNAPLAGFYNTSDLSVHVEGGNFDNSSANPSTKRYVPNTLGDLTKREYRYAHDPSRWPFDARIWGPPNIDGPFGLPTLQECSDPFWPWPVTTKTTIDPRNNGELPPNFLTPFPLQTDPAPDAWTRPYPWQQVNQATGILTAYPGAETSLGTKIYNRVGEDVMLTGVLQFDVKVWDPKAPVYQEGGITVLPGDPAYYKCAQELGSAIVSYGAYVDLGYLFGASPALTPSAFSGPGHSGSGLDAKVDSRTDAVYDTTAAVYDTGSTHYESDGIDQDGDGLIDEGTDDLDSDNPPKFGPDDPAEREAPPPYEYPLRGIQVKIRAFEPDSRAIREITIVQDFLPE